MEKSDAYMEGYRAYHNEQLSLHDNPYDKETQEWTDWDQGYWDAGYDD